MKEHKTQMSETFMLGVFLAVAGGYLDAYTYICRDHVFANAQTGNMVLLGMNLLEGKVRHALLYLIPIVAFLLGIVAAEMIRKACQESGRLHWRQFVIAVEILILLVVAVIPTGALNMVANVLVSFVCAMQVQTFRKMDGEVFATTMCTGNLRSGTDLLICYCRSKDKKFLKKALRYFGIILFFIMGAGIGALCTDWLGQWAVLLGAAVLFGTFCLMFVKFEETESL